MLTFPEKRETTRNAKPVRWVFLPGMDGTGEFFAPFIKYLPPTVESVTIRYPGNERLGYAELFDLVMAQLPKERFLLVAESFSGPLAVRIAASEPTGMIGGVVSASFVRNPLPKSLHYLAGGWLFRRPLPRWLIAAVVTGRDTPAELFQLFEHVMGQTTPEVLGFRAREALRVDVTADLRRCRLPMLFLQGGQDHLILGHNANVVRSLRPDYRVKKLSTSHCLLQRKPEEALAAIGEFAGENELEVGV